MRAIYTYRSEYPRYIGYDRGSTYFPENTDLDIFPWEMGNGSFAPIGYIPQVDTLLLLACQQPSPPRPILLTPHR